MILVGGANAVAVRASNAELAPFWGAALRLAGAGIIFWVLVIGRRTALPRGRALLGPLAYGGLAFALSYAFLYYGLKEAHAGRTDAPRVAPRPAHRRGGHRRDRDRREVVPAHRPVRDERRGHHRRRRAPAPSVALQRGGLGAAGQGRHVAGPGLPGHVRVGGRLHARAAGPARVVRIDGLVPVPAHAACDHRGGGRDRGRTAQRRLPRRRGGGGPGRLHRGLLPPACPRPGAAGRARRQGRAGVRRDSPTPHRVLDSGFISESTSRISIFAC